MTPNPFSSPLNLPRMSDNVSTSPVLPLHELVDDLAKLIRNFQELSHDSMFTKQALLRVQSMFCLFRHDLMFSDIKMDNPLVLSILEQFKVVMPLVSFLKPFEEVEQKFYVTLGKIKITPFMYTEEEKAAYVLAHNTVLSDTQWIIIASRPKW